MAADPLDTLRPAEFCALERQLVAGMAMRKKRNVPMGPVQHLKLALLLQVESTDPDPGSFTAALGEAILAVSDGLGTGPAQAVASDLQMDWDLACSSQGFVAWLRQAAVGKPVFRSSASPSPDPTADSEELRAES